MFANDKFFALNLFLLIDMSLHVVILATIIIMLLMLRKKVKPRSAISGADPQP